VRAPVFVVKRRSAYLVGVDDEGESGDGFSLSKKPALRFGNRATARYFAGWVGDGSRIVRWVPKARPKGDEPDPLEAKLVELLADLAPGAEITTRELAMLCNLPTLEENGYRAAAIRIGLALRKLGWERASRRAREKGRARERGYRKTTGSGEVGK